MFLSYLGFCILFVFFLLGCFFFFSHLFVEILYSRFHCKYLFLGCDLFLHFVHNTSYCPEAFYFTMVLSWRVTIFMYRFRNLSPSLPFILFIIFHKFYYRLLYFKIQLCCWDLHRNEGGSGVQWKCERSVIWMDRVMGLDVLFLCVAPTYAIGIDVDRQ